MGIAISLHIDNGIPDGILSKSQLKGLEKAEDRECFEYDAEFVEKLQPVRDWVLENICTAIQKKEIKPLVLGLSLDGHIDEKRTYVSDHKILRWLGYRGIDTQVHNYDCGMWEDLEERLIAIDESIIHESNLLSDKMNHCDTYQREEDNQEYDYPAYRDKINRLESSIYRLERENKRLKSEKRSPPSVQVTNPYKERHAVKREQILGAALSIIATYPDQCKNKAGRVEATKIRAAIEEKSLLFWPETAEPVLGTDKIERLIREWLKKTGE